MKSLRTIGALIIIIGAMITLYLLVSTTSPIASWSDLLITLGFYAWVMLPFVDLLVLAFVVHRKARSQAAGVAVFLTSILVVIFTVALYWTAGLRSGSSTSAIAFVFVPFYALVAIPITYLLSWLVLRTFMAKS
jgi:hypothetical protein